MATLADRFDIVIDERLSCALGVVYFMTPAPQVARKTPRWSGSALIEVGRSKLWVDQLVRTMDLEGLKVRESFERGLFHETPTLSVRGWEADGRLAVEWSMEKTAFRRVHAWRWTTAFQQALSIELGAALPLLQRDALVFPSQHLQRFKRRALVQLHPFQPFDGDFVDKPRLFKLTDFFMGDSREVHIARKLFDQMVRARQQTRWDDTELILSTALEGALRALDGVASSDPWKLHDSLARFQSKFLSPAWRHVRKRVQKAFERLRHSNAHPDWIIDKMALSAEAARSQSFDDLRLLSRFYGSMILALADVPSLRPHDASTAEPPPPPTSDPGTSGSSEVM
jgi:hypothetical protein